MLTQLNGIHCYKYAYTHKEFVLVKCVSVYYVFYMQVQLCKNVNKKGADFVFKKHVLGTAHNFICKGQISIQKHLHVLPKIVLEE